LHEDLHISRVARAQTYPTRPVRLIVGRGGEVAAVFARSPTNFGKLILN
jgi:hypothetical protein